MNLTLKLGGNMAKSNNQSRGLLAALLAIPLGILIWVFLWQYGFIASIAAFAIAYVAVWLYNWGSGSEVTKSVAPYLMGIIVLGVILAFLSGMVSDAWAAYTTELEGKEGFFSADFWILFADNLTRADLWGSYTMDIVISIAFAALGAGGVIFNLYKGDEQPKKSASKKK